MHPALLYQSAAPDAAARRRRLLSRPSLLAALTVVMACVPQSRAGTDVNVSYADLAAATLILAAAITVLRNRPRLSRRLWILGPPALAVTAATLATADMLSALPGWLRFLQIFVLVPLAMAVAVRDALDRRIVLGTVLAAALAEAAVGCWQAATGTGASFAGQLVRAVGTFGAVDVMGMASVVSYGLVIALALALEGRGRQRWWGLALVITLTPALVLSLSRGAWLAFALTALVMTALSSWRTALRLVATGACVAVLAVGLGLGGSTLTQRVTSITTSFTQPDQSVLDRYGLWAAAVGMWHDHMLVGVGPRGFAEHRDTYAPVHVSAASDTADPDHGYRRQQLLSPHNMYLLVLSEQGILGLSAFLLLGCGLLAWSARGLRTRAPARPVGPGPGRSHRRGAPRPREDAELPWASGERRLMSLTATGFLVWQLTHFCYGDVGGPPTVVMAVMTGFTLAWAVRADGVAAR
ncbi:O-antigen ligase family protein [Nonomuraea longicatena]|uniref:O-antigen ligase family protein n=1 Tax=Nonomuraea longicatena TaxID=83682 RepID=A0ABP3ZR75_9ACTN